MGGLAGHLSDGFWFVVGDWDSGTPHNQLWVELSFGHGHLGCLAGRELRRDIYFP